MVSFETINKRLGFDFMKAWSDFLLKNEYCDEPENSPDLLLTVEEVEFIKQETSKRTFDE